MKDLLRKGGIGFTVLLTCAAFTVISPFYPSVALRQGVPHWLIGSIFSTFPVASLLLSFILPQIMQKVGRTVVLITGILLVSASNILISFLSYTSRAISGFGSACCDISSTAILSTDYPSQVTALMAVINIFRGLGLIVGPIIGSLLFSIGGFSTSCRSFGFIGIIWAPIMYYLVGPSKTYAFSKKHNNFLRILSVKTVKFILLLDLSHDSSFFNLIRLSSV